jgi:uncharacterized membrane protein YhaH (DUF805 family)
MSLAASIITGLFIHLCTVFIPNFIYTLATFIPSMAVIVRRLHDTNRNGWWLGSFLLSPIPLLLSMFIVIWLGSDPMFLIILIIPFALAIAILGIIIYGFTY